MGAYAEQLVVDATHVLPIPDRLTDEDAATLTLNYGTAHAARITAHGSGCPSSVLAPSPA